MKKIILFLLFIALSLAGCGINNEPAENNEHQIADTKEVKVPSDKFKLFEEALYERGIEYEVEAKADGIISGAVAGKKYTLSDGRVFEIFQYDIDSSAYNEFKETSKMYMEMFDTYVSALVNDGYAMTPVNDEEIAEIFLSFE